MAKRSLLSRCPSYMKTRAFCKDKVSELFNFLQELLNIILMPLQSTHIMWIKLLELHLRRKLESDMEKWKIADLAKMKCKDEEPIQQLSDLSVLLAAMYLLC